ncbi:MAG: hypothetical protein ACYDC1_11960 [Limisphaerales bacterium]
MLDRHYFLGVDTAPAQTKQADDGALVVLRAEPVRLGMAAAADFQRAADPGEYHAAVEAMNNPEDWRLSAVMARKFRNLSTRQWSGAIVDLHQRFRFGAVLVDPGGGGLWVKKDLANPRQLINGVEVDAKAISTLDDPTAPVDADRILHMYRRSDRGIAAQWPELPSDDALNDAAHVVLRAAFEHGRIVLPPPAKEWRREQVQGWPEERQLALNALDTAAEQLKAVTVATDSDGTWLLTKHNCRRFGATGKKDVGYALLYAHTAFLIWLRTRFILGGGSESEEALCVW